MVDSGETMRTFRGLIQVAGLAAAGVVGLAGAASAQVQTTDVGIDQSFLQTSDSAFSTINAFFSARVFYTDSGDYTAPGTLTIPGGGANTRPLADQGYSVPELGFQDTFTGPTPLADAQAVYQTGTYTFDLPAGSQPEAIVSQSYAGDAFPNVPLVTNLSTLQNLNAADSVTFDFEPMVVSPNATPGDNYIFFYIYNASTNALVYSDLGLDPTTADITVGGNVLAPGTSYYFNLVYDDRIVDTSDPSITKTQFYDIGTTGFFATEAGVVPEPSTWAMLIVGFGGMGLLMRRRALDAAKAA